jgi:hypothetical protein
MHCLYCKKRLWLLFSKDRQFCSNLHEASYHDEMSAMNRLAEFKVAVEPPPNGPATADQKRTQRERDSRIPLAWSTVPPLSNLIVERGLLRPVPSNLPATALRLEAKPFAAPLQFPSSSRSLIAGPLDFAAEPAPETTTTAKDSFGACRIQSKRSRRVPPRSPGAFSLRTHRRRVR